MNFIKYLYIPLIITIIVLLVVILIRFIELFKKIDKDKINSITNNISITKNKTNEIAKAKDDFKFFTSLFVVSSIIKQIYSDYKQTDKSKRKLSKSVGRVCSRNVSKISKIKI